jgi:hypothetical protein
MMDEQEDQSILKALRRKKQSFRQLMNKKDVDDFELDKAFNGY